MKKTSPGKESAAPKREKLVPNREMEFLKLELGENKCELYELGERVIKMNRHCIIKRRDRNLNS